MWIDRPLRGSKRPRLGKVGAQDESVVERGGAAECDFSAQTSLVPELDLGSTAREHELSGGYVKCSNVVSNK